MHTEVGVPQYVCRGQRATFRSWLSFPFVSESQSFLVLFYMFQVSWPSEFLRDSCLHFPSYCKVLLLQTCTMTSAFLHRCQGSGAGHEFASKHFSHWGSSSPLFFRRSYYEAWFHDPPASSRVRIVGVHCVNSVDTKSWKKVSYVFN